MSSPFDLRALSGALPAPRSLTVEEQLEYTRLRQRVEGMTHGFAPTGDPSQQPGADYYGVWAGRDVGIFATWASCSESVTGYPGNGYKKYPNWAAAVDAVTEHLWLKQHRVSTAGFGTRPVASPGTPARISSPSTVSSVTASTRIALSPRTPSRSPRTPSRSPATDPHAMPTPTPIIRAASPQQEYFVVSGKRSASFFVDRAEAAKLASELQQRQELEQFGSSVSFSDALHTLTSAAEDAAERTGAQA
ncbi:hypothetical protein C8F01DRAFT_1264861 [Mycena amicta]|nr:hypothetical protein C8F01DRAFT_1264793 [Mycena amicta]KAJ7049816.1 hypothetical protein C8F01DRAFT_1264861 [Mycena amicta]